ncbi:hypothetical protein BFU36_08445 [Sulfolobus sp. A20]|nr:hypothetical protein BFU36_08445 [Sulfolobus sp. A20]TRM74871.1 hypothetical protein DJ528_09910 [Sulfolobus sp. B5]TRM77881.1 hypothetical protein DJ532_03050 [Sulfolobus sp. A20-N-F8]TRM80869.1 hypothetical protein DJ524_06050 [Sulfolobus sp. D5]TRM97953.1 hypothetical protein DMP16_00790 [Sulfolobus sp. B1]TRN02184.1 hypothetical protein DJ530_04630 [Sulfolobus sp. E1]
MIDEISLMKKIFLIIEDNVPEDCRELIIKRIKERLIKDSLNLGVEETIKKWLYEEEKDEDKEEVILLE